MSGICFEISVDADRVHLLAGMRARVEPARARVKVTRRGQIVDSVEAVAILVHGVDHFGLGVLLGDFLQLGDIFGDVHKLLYEVGLIL
jgi:hypothetical protein